MRRCNRCGNPLLKKNGTPDFRKHFCSKECAREDARDKIAARRKLAHGRKCRLCGRAAPKNGVLFVRGETKITDYDGKTVTVERPIA